MQIVDLLKLAPKFKWPHFTTEFLNQILPIEYHRLKNIAANPGTDRCYINHNSGNLRPLTRPWISDLYDTVLHRSDNSKSLFWLIGLTGYFNMISLYPDYSTVDDITYYLSSPIVFGAIPISNIYLLDAEDLEVIDGKLTLQTPSKHGFIRDLY